RTEHLPVDFELYLPECWASDEACRRDARIPAEVAFETKSQLTLRMIERAVADGVAPGVLLADTAYGSSSDFRARLRSLVLPSTLVDGRVSRLDDGRRNPESVQGPTAAWRRCPPGSLEPPRAPAQAATVDSPRGIASRRGHHRR
ncbi:transposase, partial [Corallococcus terminator]